MSTPLCELAREYGSDKCPEIKHNYTPFYYEFLKDALIKKVLEIGIGDAAEMAWTEVPGYVTGASLRMWRDFFPHAQVYGMDIREGCLFEDPRIKTFVGDQNRVEDLKRVIGETGTDLDLVIDDGSHNPDAQVFTCRTLMPLLDIGVIYIIEDVGHPEIVDRLSEYDCWVPKLQRKVRRDDRLLVVRHKDG